MYAYYLNNGTISLDNAVKMLGYMGYELGIIRKNWE